MSLADPVFLNPQPAISTQTAQLGATLSSPEAILPLSVNEQARRARHLRVFARAATLRRQFSFLSSFGKRFFKHNAEGAASVRSILTPYFHLNRLEHRLDVSPSHKLFTRYSILVAVLFVIGSYSPGTTYTDASFSADMQGLWQSSNIEAPIVADQEGYLIKANPQTNLGDRSTMNDYLVHTVASGETISTIASSYDLKTSTLVWANNIINANALRVGQKILIPPVDGISHTVAKNETVDKLAKSYNISADAILKQNSITSKTLVAGEDIFLPGAKPLASDLPTPAKTTGRDTPARIASAGRVNNIAADGAILQGSKDVPVGDKPFIWPTHGKLTQGYHAGHYAYDIANPSRPAVWAPGSGTVIKVAEGCGDVSYGCNGGYGNHVIIDAGNGIQILLAHLTYATVKVGQHVNTGDVIGKMGRSGNVHGVTGIHTHLEIRLNGVRVDPGRYVSIPK